MMARLGDVCEILNGFAFKSDQYVDSGVRIIRIANVQKGYIEDHSPVYYPARSSEAQKYALCNNDLLMSLTGNVGRVALLEEKYLPAVLNQRVACLRIKDGVKLCKKFLYHFLNSDYFEEMCVAASKGVAQKNVSTEWLKDYNIPLASIEKQNQVVNALDKLDDLISLRKQQLAKLDELVKVRFVEMFGTLTTTKYSSKTLDELCVFIKDGTHQTPTYTEDTKNGIKFLSSKDVTSGRIDWTRIKYIPQDLHKELYARIAPKRGDILLAKNGTTGIPAVVDTDDVFDIYVSLALLRFKDGNNITYLWAALSALETKRQFESSLKGIGVPNLHLSEIKKVKIIVPPIELQNKFSGFVGKINGQKLTIQKSLDKLEILKKSLMQEYFGGGEQNE